jgi:hypothetical protein
VNSPDELKKEIAAIAAENLALQFVFTCLVQRLGEVDPALKKPILQAYDDAANHAEKFSLLAGKQSGHLPETLRIIEMMRSMLVGRDKPQREV